LGWSCSAAKFAGGVPRIFIFSPDGRFWPMVLKKPFVIIGES
jgi:hypothetical protein